MKSLFIIFLLLGNLSFLFALERFEELLIKKAVYPEQKQAVKKYLQEKAAHLHEEAKTLREAAEVRRGGKKIYQKNVKKEALEKANVLEAKAKEYERAADKL